VREGIVDVGVVGRIWVDGVPAPCDKTLQCAWLPAILSAKSPYGRIADETMTKIPMYYPTVSVNKYPIMPNHIHRISETHDA